MRPSVRGRFLVVIIAEKRYSEEPRAHVHSSQEQISGASPLTGHILWLYVRKCVVFASAVHMYIYIYMCIFGWCFLCFAVSLSSRSVYRYMHTFASTCDGIKPLPLYLSISFSPSLSLYLNTCIAYLYAYEYVHLFIFVFYIYIYIYR